MSWNFEFETTINTLASDILDKRSRGKFSLLPTDENKSCFPSINANFDRKPVDLPLKAAHYSAF